MESRAKPLKKSSTTKPTLIRQANLEDLKNTELFADVEPEAIQEIRQHSYVCKLDADKTLHTTRGTTNYLYVILKGYVAIWVPSCFDPKQRVFLAWRGPQQIIGELRQPGAKPSSTRIRTCDECEFIEIPLQVFFRVAAKHGLLYRNVAHLLLKKMSNEGHRSEVVQMRSARSARRQVAQTLIHLAQDRCEGFSFADNRIEIPGTLRQTQMAAYAGIKRETVNRELKILRSKQIISSGSPITILNLKELQTIVETKPEPNRKKSSAKNPKRPVKK